MVNIFQNKLIIVSLILSLIILIFYPAHSYAEGEEVVSITINQVQQDEAGEAQSITLSSDGSNENAVTINLDNPAHKVGVISMDICAEDNYLTLTGCDTTDRTGGFLCRSRGSDDGCSSVTLFSMNRLGVIEEGTGPIFILRYTYPEETPAEACTTFSTENTHATDDGGNDIEVVSSPGEYCFGSAASACELRISPETAEAAAGESIPFDAITTGTGCDNPCYAWEITGTSGGTIDIHGLYTAGAPGTDLITVIDDCHGEIIATAEVIVLEDADEDGILDEEDSCLESNLEETISIYTCDSGVENLLLDDGCSLKDLIDECDHTLNNQGMFVICVSRLTNGWKKEGWISRQEKGAIQRCAAQSWRERRQTRTGEEDE